MYKTPPYLQKNDQVALITPAGYIEDEKPLKFAEEVLNSWSLKPIRGQYVLENNGHFAGTDEQRLQDLQEALDDPKIKAIWAVRGGYGSMRILSKLNFEKFKKHPKWLIGFSDITAIHSAIHLLNFKSIHGLMPVQLTDNEGTKDAVKSLHTALFDGSIENIIPASKFNKVGSTKGTLIGGNLSLLQSLLGSSYQINTKGKVLFLEEVGEQLYRIDRLLQSLKLAGYFENLKGLIIGGFTAIPENDTPYNQTYQEIILEIVADYNFPVLFDIPSGHFSNNRALIFGDKVTLNVGEYVSCIRSQPQ
jgi:muramoyltetrapeptide carboxypeptidase